jgi:hypothetical protein
MERRDLPGCCTGEILVGFSSLFDSIDEYLKEIKSKIKLSRNEGNKLLIAITTQRQKNGAKALEKAGFLCDPATSNKTDLFRHEDTALILWSYDLTKQEGED